MSSTEHVFIQPWLNREEQWEALVVSCIGGPEACSKAVAALCQNAETHTLGHNLLWFVPIETDTCLGAVDHWPSERSVFMLREPAEPVDDAAWFSRFAPLLESKHRLAIIANPARPLPPPAGPWKWLITQTAHARTTSPYTLMGLAARMSLVLTGVASRSDFDWAVANSAQMMSGEYILHRNPQAQGKPDITRVRLLKLLSLVTQDADTKEIEEIFRQEPKLSYSLMRLVNSAALNLRGSVTSYSQAIAILGRRQLQRWIQLLVYADTSGGNQTNPLLLQAALRGRLIELACTYAAPGDEPAPQADEAFMVGIFSLLDVLLGISMDDILAQLPLANNINRALALREGRLGQLLSAVESAEQRQFETASRLLTKAGIGCEDYATVQLDALNWAHSVSQDA